MLHKALLLHTLCTASFLTVTSSTMELEESLLLENEYSESTDVSPHISPVSATASQVLPWLRYVSVHDPQRVKNTPAVANLTCLATKGLKTPRDETDEICGLIRTIA